MFTNDWTINPSPLKERLRAAHQWGLEAAYLTLGYFDQTLKQRGQVSNPSGEDHYRIERKADLTFVTTADREAETLLRSRIEAAFTEDSIVGEEFGSKKGANDWTWYLDPIDGTQAFVHGVPLFGTLIGLEYEGVSVAGVIVLPALGESIYAGKNLGCFWNRGFIKEEAKKSFVGAMTTRAQVSKISALKEALFCTTWMQSFKATHSVDLFYKLCDETGVFRGWGDCYGYALVATGRAEIMVDPQLMVWDAAPMLVILEEAGGRYTDFSGEGSIHSGSGFATNGLLHQSVLTILKGGS